jgi:hypothetical protein
MTMSTEIETKPENDVIYRCYFFSAFSHERFKVVLAKSVKSKAELLDHMTRFIETYEQSDVACEVGLTFSFHNNELGQEFSHSFRVNSITLKDAMPLFKLAKLAIEACPYE